MYRGLQTIFVLADSDGDRITGGLEQIQTQTTDRFINGIGFAGDLQAVDGQRRIHGKTINVAGASPGHFVSADNLQFGNTVHRNIGTGTCLARTEHQTRSILAVDDVGRDAFFCERGVD
ncbi:hypothetical protein D3C77_471170 [compost metagenome]